MLYLFLPLLAPALLLAVAVRARRSPGLRPAALPRLAEYAGLGAFVVSVMSAGLLMMEGPGSSPLLGLLGVGLSVRLDVVSVVMLCLVSFIGWIVLRYSATYMDGEARQGAFTGWMAATLAAVLLLVMSGNLVQLVLAWTATSLCLHQLLLFYRDRTTARRAARKKALVARASEVSLAIAALLLIMSYGTSDIATILATAAPDLLTITAAVLIALAAVLASAQFPTHGWLTEVMEAPTPVSALLHAGVINAGGFLLIRFADVMLAAPAVMALLVMLGGFTALFGGLVMLTQSAVKTSLAWSTIAQMAFMIMQCGLALFPLALLHIVAHSLYKAHAFLSAGEAVANVAAIRRPGPVAVPSGRNVMQAFGIGIVIYALVGAIFGFDGKSVQAIALGVILIFGVAYILAQGLADAAPGALTRRTVIYATATSVSYFLLQLAALKLTAGTLPATPAPGPLEWALILLALVSFGAVAVAQATFPLWAMHPAAAGLRVHLSNGLYANAIFDRLLGGWSKRTQL
ncbi:proton-conducting transporter transmembrane domain-containing protein [Phaeobacter gallaeciensis]|uniref:Probable inorganic carbon transporter subunit DabB n=1 Tax=Phaeobacter gallaeciensis TaxID=60890 RepID=A0AAD0EFF6_9RHOB|nr:proton-conducting transporter membrane subunit [Phaeobacter gallaeciensis]AHD11964.1 NADH:ubiquinone oxidoreductase subunit 5 (chain L)/Multisubunit Na+/H+ antiporter, MnhA subunit [Phaeobacter gallaeciensis DSM 26640]ATE95230.1 putative NADH-ubiquinone oxidoreductase [Phaeobacter gallaeciensis]ATE99621.1 putative NADH-ubiquinone oxidoreductase [Phaeobacter gallaeciensis]ATF03935.1 putative NADH-ubiquinone oxidoreductase [Phaeobacter gallaeciensis]ATF08211.1 putative NADH-ubiquinone oxidore